MNTTVKETSPYDNCMDLKDVDTIRTLADFIDDPIFSEKTPSYKAPSKISDGAFKNIYVSFRNQDDLYEFANLIDQDILVDDIWYPEKTLISQAYTKPDTRRAYIGIKKIKKNSNKLPVDNKWKKVWVGMPEFIQEEKEPYFKITMRFRDADNYVKFGKIIDQNLSENTNSIWYPKLDRDANARKRWVEPKGKYTNPVSPVYIVSKGRSDSMLTSRSFARMKMPHYIAIEPQDLEDYTLALATFNINSFATLLVLPFSNHGDGPGRARNWCWDHAISIGSKMHYVCDDNISDFYRLHKNERIRVESGAIFKAAEDFVDRFENVPIAGFQYRFFIAPNAKYPPYVTNTRIYSTLLIDNDCPYRWRGRYNEDTDICLRVLKDGLCTIQFNSFLQGKAATQTLAGGNTSEFYAAEGTDPKSEMLYRMHPDVTTKVIRFGRHHHFVDYNQFKKNKLILRKDAQVPDGINNYGMELITDYAG